MVSRLAGRAGAAALFWTACVVGEPPGTSFPAPGSDALRGPAEAVIVPSPRTRTVPNPIPVVPSWRRPGAAPAESLVPPLDLDALTAPRRTAPQASAGSSPAAPPSPLGVADRDPRNALALDLGSLSERRDAALELAIVRERREDIVAIAKEGKYGEARTAALALGRALTTQDAFLAVLPILALTDSDTFAADRHAVAALLEAVEDAAPSRVANAYAAATLHCYRLGDLALAQDIHGQYGKRFPNAKPRPALLLASSLCLVKHGDLPKAREALLPIVRDFPTASEAPRAALLMGWIDLSCRNYPEARASLELLIRAYPDNPCAAKAREILSRVPKTDQ